LAVAKVGNPLDDLGVVRNDPAVRLVMLKRARGIPEIQVAEDREVPVREMKVRELGQRRLVAGARIGELPLRRSTKPSSLYGGRGVADSDSSALRRLASAWSKSPVRAYANAEIEVRRRQLGRPLGDLDQQGDPGSVPLRLEHAHRRVVVGAHVGVDACALR
jgi:hypothetical protein